MLLSVCTVAAAGMAAAQPGGVQPLAAPRSTPVSIRDYDASRDYAAILDICRAVFGGKDPLPKALAGLPTAPGVCLWVAEAEGGDATDGVLGAHLRGEVALLFGARVREQARGRGLGAALLAHAEAHMCRQAGVSWMLSATILANEAMCHLFTKHGFATLAEIDIWPRQSAVREAARLLSAGKAKGEPVLLRALPAEAATLLQQAGNEVRELTARWQMCTSPEQLLPLHAALRRSRAAHWGAGLDSGAIAWLPFDFKLEPLVSATLQQKVQEGRLWMLHPPAVGVDGTSGSGGCDCRRVGSGEVDAAMLVFHKSHNHNSEGNWLAGVVAGSARALAAAVHKALELEPCCTELYIDRCACFAAPAFLRAAAGRPGGGYVCDDGPSHYLVLAKRVPLLEPSMTDM